MWTDLKPIDLTKIPIYPYPEDKYFKEEWTKTQIVLHHTVSGPNIEGDVSTWIDGKYNIGTCIIVDRDGVPWQLFSSRYWAYHLGSGDHEQDRRSIGIEIDNWGWLIPGDGTVKHIGTHVVHTIKGKYYNSYGYPVNVDLQEYSGGFRGYNFYEKYTMAQIQTVGELLLYWRNKYDIPLTYNSDMWDVSQRALNGEPGVWTHISFRGDKSDCHPQTDLVEMLQAVQNI
jgi:hypothetical protein